MGWRLVGGSFAALCSAVSLLAVAPKAGAEVAEVGKEPQAFGVERAGVRRSSIAVAPPSEDSVSAAAYSGFTDAQHDSHCYGDITRFEVNYDTAVIGLNLTTLCGAHPVTAANWWLGYSMAAWYIDVDGDGYDNYGVFFYNDGNQVVAEVMSPDGAIPVCPATPSFTTNVYGVSFDPACIGRPDSIYVQAAMQFDNHPYGVEPCSDCWWDYAPDASYSPPVQAPPIGNGPGAASPAAGVIDVFARGQDDALWTRHNGGSWAPWNSLGGIVTSTPGVASKAEGTLDVFIRGQEGALWSRHFNGTTWGAWYSLGGILSTAPGVVSSSPGTLDVFVAGQDRALWRRHFNGVSWSPWMSLGGIVVASPAAASSDPGTLSVFVRGQDGILWSRSATGGVFGPWGAIGGQLRSAPSATSSGSGALEVYARGVDRSLVFWRFSSGSWAPQVSMGGFVEAPPAAVSATDGTVDVFIRGADAAMWTNHFVIGGGAGGWNSLGGIIR